MSCVTPSSASSDCCVAYADRESPRELICEFVRILRAMARVRRRIMLSRYSRIIEHVTAWFKEKYIEVDLEHSCREPGEDLACINKGHISDLVGGYGDEDEDDRTKYIHEAQRNLEVYSREIKLLARLKRFINLSPVLGFNSSGYDIPLIKDYLFPELVDIVPSEASIEFVKKTSRYVSLTINGLHAEGGLVFLDVMQYLAPGFNLDNFIRSFAATSGDQQKSYFPYEYLDGYDRLGETSMPPYEAFYSRLRQENQLDSEYRRYLIDVCNLSPNTLKGEIPEEIVATSPPPDTGREKYEKLCRMWTDKGWNNLGDYLRYYNVQDVVPFLIGVCGYAREFSVKEVDMVRDAISLPGLAKQILLKHVPHRSLYYIDSPFVYSTIRRNEVGGQSIIFTRKNDPERHPYIKGFDANSLYLYCLGEGQYTGKPTVYDEVSEFACGLMYRRKFASGRAPVGTKHVDNRDSVAAEEYLDYLEDVYLAPRGVHLHRQYRIVLSSCEKKYLANRFAEEKVLLWNMFSNIYVDGYYVLDHSSDEDEEARAAVSTTLDKKSRHVVEYDGCFWHACEVCGAADKTKFFYRRKGRLTVHQIRALTEFRYEILEKRGYVIHRVRECEWTSLRKDHPDIDSYCVEHSRRVDPLIVDKDRAFLTSASKILTALREKRVFGITVCDVRVPEEKRKSFEDFAPIIKHAVINYEDIGPFMQRLCDSSGIVVKDRRSVIDSYHGENIALTDEYLVWLMERGVVVDRVRTFIRYRKEAIFKEFADNIIRLRIKGDRDKSSEMQALTAKLIGNSAFGSCITNKDKHRDVKLQSFKSSGDYYNKAMIASMLTFVKYEEISPTLLEVEKKRDKVVYDQMRYVAKAIFDRAKLSVLKFYHDFLKRVLKEGCYSLMETDTDSIYLALTHEKFEDNIDPDKMDLYERLKSQYFLTADCGEFGKRQPNRYKVECEGHQMVSLCSKSYCVYNRSTNRVKLSSKGVQKSNFYRCYEDDDDDSQTTFGETAIDMYQKALDSGRSSSVAKTGIAVNRGLRRKYEQTIMYEQEKVMFNSVYCKRRVLDDGIHTVPLDL